MDIKVLLVVAGKGGGSTTAEDTGSSELFLSNCLSRAISSSYSRDQLRRIPLPSPTFGVAGGAVSSFSSSSSFLSFTSSLLWCSCFCKSLSSPLQVHLTTEFPPMSVILWRHRTLRAFIFLCCCLFGNILILPALQRGHGFPSLTTRAMHKKQ